MIDITKGTNFEFIGREKSLLHLINLCQSQYGELYFLVALFSIQNLDFHSNLSIFSLIRFGVLDNTKAQNLVSLSVIINLWFWIGLLNSLQK